MLQSQLNQKWAYDYSGKSLDCTHNMSVDGVVGGDICELGLQPDLINITCSVRFSGNIPPTLSWSHNSPRDIIYHSVADNVVPNSRVTSIIVIQANNDMNGSRFSCSASFIWTANNKKTPQAIIVWTSQYFKLLCKCALLSQRVNLCANFVYHKSFCVIIQIWFFLYLFALLVALAIREVIFGANFNNDLIFKRCFLNHEHFSYYYET